MSLILRLCLVVILGLFFTVGFASRPETTRAGASVCKTTYYGCSTWNSCCSVVPSCNTTCTRIYCSNFACTSGMCACPPGYFDSCSTTCQNVCQGCWVGSTCSSTTCTSLPDAPVLTSPANGSTNSSSVFSLTWNATDPDNYPTTPMYYEVSVQPPGGSFANICNFTAAPACPRGSNGQSVSYSYTASSYGTYTWRVRAWDGWTDGSGNPVYSNYSTSFTFTRANAVSSAPTLSAPANGSSSNISSRTLSWSATDSDNGPTTPMYFEVGIQAPGSSSFSNLCNFTGAPACPRGSSGQTVSTNHTTTTPGTYSWRVRSWDGGNDLSGNPVYSAYSSTQTFTYTNVSPDTPTLISPVNGSYNLGQALLQWTSNDPDSGPNSYIDYELVIRSTDGLYNGGFSFFNNHAGSNNQTVGYNFAPQKGGTFFWKVRARDGATDSAGNQITSAFSEERTVFIDYNCP